MSDIFNQHQQLGRQ